MNSPNSKERLIAPSLRKESMHIFLNNILTTYKYIRTMEIARIILSSILISINILNILILLSSTSTSTSLAFIIYTHITLFVSIIILCGDRRDRNILKDYIDHMNAALKPCSLQLNARNNSNSTSVNTKGVLELKSLLTSEKNYSSMWI